MAHAKCDHCRARVWRDTHAGEIREELCPGCGGELDSVTDLSELVGLRALRVRPRRTHRDDTERFERISQQIRDTIARLDASTRPLVQRADASMPESTVAAVATDPVTVGLRDAD